MSQPYVGEIRMFGGTFAPVGWALCDGQLLPIAENEVLFQLIGTTYGGDGESTFALPNLQSRIPMHMGTNSAGLNRSIGLMEGVEEVTLTVQQIPLHHHVVGCRSEGGNSRLPTNAVPAIQTGNQAATYEAEFPSEPMNAGAIAPTGGSQPHSNMQPFLVINFIISLFGIFPSQT